MLNVLRPAMTRLFTPLGKVLARTPITPNAITVIGTVGVAGGALSLFPLGELFPGAFTCTIFVFLDMLDGVLARLKGTSGTWGAFLDSTMDRIADAGIFGGLVIWFMLGGHNSLLGGVSLFCLVTGGLVSYAKARAEGLGLRCDVGLIERPERMLISLVAVGVSGLGVPYILNVGLWALAAGSAFTFWQRVHAVYKAAKGPGDQGGSPGDQDGWERLAVAVLSRRLSERLTGVAYQLGWKVICRIPLSWARWIFTEVADIAWRRQGPKVQVLEGNLRRVLSWQHDDPKVDGTELRTLSRTALRSYARYWLEVFRLPVIPTERLVAGMHFRGPGEVAVFANLKAGRGVIIALPHMGNFEQAGAWIIARGAGTLTTVAERLRPESVYESFVRFREALGFEVLPLTGGASPFGTLAQRLRAGGLVCLVSDRDLKESGVEVEMFGEKARIAATAALAVHTGAALMPTATWFDGDEWGACIYDEIPVPEAGTRAEKVAAMSQQLARVFTEAIAEHPQDWHMLQRVFTADLDPARLPVQVPPPRSEP